VAEIIRKASAIISAKTPIYLPFVRNSSESLDCAPKKVVKPVSDGLVAPVPNSRFGVPDGLAVSVAAGSACHWKVWLIAVLEVLLKAEATRSSGCELAPWAAVATAVAGKASTAGIVPAPFTSSVVAAPVPGHREDTGCLPSHAWPRASHATREGVHHAYRNDSPSYGLTLPSPKLRTDSAGRMTRLTTLPSESGLPVEFAKIGPQPTHF